MESKNSSSSKKSTSDKKNLVVKKTAPAKKAVIKLNNKVQMARPLYYQLTGSPTNFSLTELKLIDVYLAAINSHKPENRLVVFEKGTLEKLFGVKRLHKDVLDSCFDTLLQSVIVLSNEESSEDKTKIDKSSFVLFSRARLIQDTDGLWKVYMECSEKAAQLIFNIDKIGYLQHPLSSTVRLKSRSSYVVLKFIESHRNNKGKYPQEFEASFDELREQLFANKYSEWRDFRRAVLLAAQSEIQEKTNTRFDFEPIRIGRRIQMVKFTIYQRANVGADASRVVDETLSDFDVEKAVKVVEDKAEISEIEGTILSEEIPEVTVDLADNYEAHYYYNNAHDAHLEKLGKNKGEVFPSEKYDVNSSIAFLAAACKNEFYPSQMEFVVRFIGDFTKDENEQYELLSDAYGILKKQNVSEINQKYLCFKSILANVCEKLIKNGNINGQQYDLSTEPAFFGAACANEFTKDEMIFLLRFIKRHLSDEYIMYNYLKDKYILLNAADKGQIEKRFNYFRTMVANDEELLIQLGIGEK